MRRRQKRRGKEREKTLVDLNISAYEHQQHLRMVGVKIITAYKLKLKNRREKK